MIAEENDFALVLPDGVRHLQFKWVNPGSFWMGQKDDPELGYFNCRLTAGFWMSAYAVTQAQWRYTMRLDASADSESADLPADNISSADAMAFCDAVNSAHKSTLPLGCEITLPTQAQWEYTCRAGTESLYYCGDSPECLEAIAWYGANSNGRTHPVGLKQPNRWAFYDMLGNVSEWCLDAPADYPTTASVDWQGRLQG